MGRSGSLSLVLSSRSGSRGLSGSSPTTRGSLPPVGPGPVGPVPLGPEPGTIADPKPPRPSATPPPGDPLPPCGPGPVGPVPLGPEPGTIDDRKPTRPCANASPKPPVNGSSYCGKTQSVYWLNSQYAWQSACWRQLYAPMLTWIG